MSAMASVLNRMPSRPPDSRRIFSSLLVVCSIRLKLRPLRAVAAPVAPPPSVCDFAMVASILAMTASISASSPSIPMRSDVYFTLKVENEAAAEWGDGKRQRPRPPAPIFAGRSLCFSRGGLL